MGNAQVQSKNDFFAGFTSTATTAINNISNVTSSNCTAANILQVTSAQNCNFNCTGCTLNIFQNSNAYCTFNSTLIQNSISDVSNAVSQAAADYIKQNASNTTGFLGYGLSLQANSATTEEDLSSAITNYISNNITNQCSAVTDAINNGVLNLCGQWTGSIINVQQNANVTSLTSCAANVFEQAWVSNSTTQNFLAVTDQALTNDNEGITGIFKWIAFAIAGIVAIVIIIFLVSALSSGRSSPTPISTVVPTSTAKTTPVSTSNQTTTRVTK